MRERIQELFPLLETNFEITSPIDGRYNCVAWAAGDMRRWWWPAESPYSYWPPGSRRDESVAAFIDAFSTLGYEVAASGDYEIDFEKVAIFASNEGVPTHMARQLANGAWTSKLGSIEDIEHRHADGVSGAEYGGIVTFLRRKRVATA